MMPIAQLVELKYKMLASYGMRVPQLTPSRIRLLSCSRTFNCSKAKDRIFYTPIVSLQEGLKRTLDSYSHLRAEHQPKREGPSKSYLFLGSGNVADTLLWKDKKQTISTLFVSVALYYHFITSGYTIITAIFKLLMVATVFLFVHGILPAKIFGYSIEKISPSSFPIPQERCHRIGLLVGSMWNSAINDLQSLCKGKDWALFFKVCISLLFLSFLGSTPIQTIFLTGVPFAFIAFFVYEKKEEEIDCLVHKALSFGCRLKSNVSKRFVTSK